MKNLKLGISALALTVASTVFAQTTSNPWLIGVGAHGVNHVAVGGGNAFKVASSAFGGDDANRLYSINNFTITPPLSKLTVARNLNKYLVLDWQTTVGNIDNKRIGMDKQFFLQTGLGLQFKFNGLWNEESWFDPYVRVGANYLRHDYSGVTFPVTDYYHNVNYPGFSNGEPFTQRKKDHFTVATGLGSNFWFTKNFGLGIQGDYVATPVDKSDIANFWQASASILFRFGNTDRDKDGIPDKDDRCPDTPGLAEFQGCPDTDGDGIPDIDDQCPDVAGPKENNGCPWPDTDGDGVIDKDDACPTVAGPAENKGCPWPDTDGDGILDKDDACPTVFGLKEYNGCPKPKSVTASEVEGVLKNIYFDFNKATITKESSAKLDEAAKIIKTDGGNYLLEGQTDAKGSEAYNLDLSRRRAKAVVDGLDARGVDPTALKSIGVGKSKATVPATASDAERQKDRKVVVTAIEDATVWENYKKSDVVEPVKKAPAKKAPAKKAPAKKKK
ncbi:OmpA family protein [Chryseobacterium koreense]|uniref:Membrane protein n=1 Tax=Chryseobacterium koreense CCUG 49689 TaxID=1304281 RepID=A0A0J7IY27_9FLAO|nr:OmpA family protein [Chryseobacterium koreense]KMQ70726.1 membrane protein [Chryseobacterium koreense CCUG 49689]MBB5333613.1 outer membrane protein OmpA-like peptidoglycan-associated protein [Chryseobacterium koreense]